MTVPEPPRQEMPLVCPSCGRMLDALVVNPAGELIGCEDCAAERGLAGRLLTLEEWSAEDLIQDVLQHYTLQNPKASKPLVSETSRPRAHYWEVTAGNKRYFLKRFHEWYPAESIHYTHSILSALAEEALPVPRWVPDRDGKSFVETGGSNWALYVAREGRQATDNEWMWGRPKAAEMLATLHVALEGCTPEGEPFQPWTAWTMDTVDRVLESWQPHPDLPQDLLHYVRERLATRYFGDLYPQLPKQVVHGDYTQANALWRGEAMNMNICGVLDFESAHPDTVLLDFAWGLGDRRPPLLRATVAAYGRVRPLAPIEREALPDALLLGVIMGIDMQMSYYHNMREVARLSQELGLMVRDMESLRKAVALKAPASM